MKYCRVIFPVSAPDSYTYAIPDHLSCEIFPGSRVRAELGKKQSWGFVCSLTNEVHANISIKPILDIFPAYPVLSDKFVDFINWLASYYMARPGDVLRSVMPKLLLKRLEKEKWEFSKPEINTVEIKLNDELNTEQRDAALPVKESMQTRNHRVFLLQGVTGSGKSHVYYHLAKEALCAGRTALILVPEISLTPQTVKNFTSIFGEEVAVLHSGLTEKARALNWMKLLSGEKRIAVGVRSAIFAPLKNIGLIVVDEEHDGSYSQSEKQFCYQARDAAVMRGMIEGAAVVLGSATPSLESRRNADAGKYTLLKLNSRYSDRPLPKVHLVDLRKEREAIGNSLFSRLLVEKMEDRFSKGEQIILLKNRRGYAPFVQCSACGFVPMCSRCSVSLTYHRGVERLICHYCDKRERYSEKCTSCGADAIYPAGAGVERIQSDMEKRFPGIKLLRLDLDTGSKAGATAEILEDFRTGKADVLIGTQMVSKGLDFQRVTLVGVLLAETGLFLPDFRAQERAFQLLTQVSGRSGRGETPGEVVLQTYLPDEPAVVAAVAQDFEKFYNGEIKIRQALKYPPFARAVLIRFFSKAEEKGAETAKRFAANIPGSVIKLGPAPAPIAKVRGLFRHFILIRGGSSQELHDIVRKAYGAINHKGGSVKIQIVFDPDSLL
ncbi:MAG: primosomal protein N' [Fibrobacteres bacterium]|nr:primosomal protein N' [Fibrobacterota bacterium]